VIQSLGQYQTVTIEIVVTKRKRLVIEIKEKKVQDDKDEQYVG